MSDLWDRRREEHERREAEEQARQHSILDAGSVSLAPPDARPRRSLSEHPALLSALLGAVGGIAGVLVGGVLSPVLDVLVGETVLKSALAPDYAEGIGYLLGMYCLIMFPCGGAIAGTLPGALVGVYRASRDRQLHPLYPILAGMLVTFLVTIAGALGVLVLLRR